MFATFFKNFLLRVSIYLRRFFAPPKHAIHRVILEYDSTGEQCDNDSAFWRNEERFWEPELEENETNITWMYRNRMSIEPIPRCVSDVTFRVTYEHDGSVYKYVTRDVKHQWPPKKVPGFHPPIKEAWAIMFDGTHVNVTDRVKKFAGACVRVGTAPLAALTCRLTSQVPTVTFTERPSTSRTLSANSVSPSSFQTSRVKREPSSLGRASLEGPCGPPLSRVLVDNILEPTLRYRHRVPGVPILLDGQVVTPLDRVVRDHKAFQVSVFIHLLFCAGPILRPRFIREGDRGVVVVVRRRFAKGDSGG
jgi:hypothetical protein